MCLNYLLWESKQHLKPTFSSIKRNILGTKLKAYIIFRVTVCLYEGIISVLSLIIYLKKNQLRNYFDINI